MILIHSFFFSAFTTFSIFFCNFALLLCLGNSLLCPSFHENCLHRIMPLNVTVSLKKNFRQFSKFLKVKESKFTIQSQRQPSTMIMEAAPLNEMYPKELTARLYFSGKTLFNGSFNLELTELPSEVSD